jgi:1,4-alpha-glucan branching enzyme
MFFKPYLLPKAVLFALAFLFAFQASAQHRGAFMEIFVRSWRDSNGDGIGDLNGLTQSLDHLQDLGVKGIWLMPITTSADHDHGYATTDFRNIDPDYGTLADFDALIKAAHARGIGVIMDYVLNHSASDPPFFQDALRNPQSPYRVGGHAPWQLLGHLRRAHARLQHAQPRCCQIPRGQFEVLARPWH